MQGPPDRNCRCPTEPGHAALLHGPPGSKAVFSRPRSRRERRNRTSTSAIVEVARRHRGSAGEGDRPRSSADFPASATITNGHDRQCPVRDPIGPERTGCGGLHVHRQAMRTDRLRDLLRTGRISRETAHCPASIDPCSAGTKERLAPVRRRSGPGCTMRATSPVTRIASGAGSPHTPQSGLSLEYRHGASRYSTVDGRTAPRSRDRVPVPAGSPLHHMGKVMRHACRGHREHDGHVSPDRKRRVTEHSRPANGGIAARARP